MNPFTSLPPPFPTFTTADDSESNPPPLKDRRSSSGPETSDDEDVSLSQTEKLALALSCKDEGTRKFKENDFIGARDLYKQGLKKLGENDDEGISDDSSTDNNENNFVKQIKETRILLNLNLALCHIKLMEWIEAVHNASAVLKLEPKNIKALYRRGLARSNLGFLDEARVDLFTVYELQPTNIEARNELSSVKKRLAETRERDKKSFTGLFTKASGLYNDREKEIAKKKELEKQEQKKEMEEFEMLNKARESNGETPFESFEAWKKFKEEEAKKKKKEQQKSQKTNASKGDTSINTSLNGSTAIEFDEEDQKIVSETKKMGYCYFNRTVKEDNLPATAAAPIPSNLIPIKLDDKTTEPFLQQNDELGSNNKSLSTWNKAGTTYEERDCSTWFQNKIKQRFTDDIITINQPNYTLTVEKISDVVGEAQVVVLRSSKRYLYDLSFQIFWTLIFQNENKIKGSINLTDVASSGSVCTIGDDSCPDWLVDAKINIESSYNDDQFKVVQDATNFLKKEIMQRVKLAENDFRNYA